MNASPFHSHFLYFYDNTIEKKVSSDTWFRSKQRITLESRDTTMQMFLNTVHPLLWRHRVGHFRVFPSNFGGDESEPQLQRRAELFFDAFDVLSYGVPGKLVLDVIEQIAESVHKPEWMLLLSVHLGKHSVVLHCEVE